MTGWRPRAVGNLARMTPWGQGDPGAEDGPGPGPPHPDDRLWRHPSELSDAGAPSPRPSGRPGVPGWLRSPEARNLRRPALSVLAGVVVGAALATAGVVLVGAGGGTGEPAAGGALAGAGNDGAGSATSRTSAGSGRGVVATASTAAVGATLAAPVGQVASEMVRVEVERGGSTTWGCGFPAGASGVIVTAAALVQGSSGLSVTGAGGERDLATLLGSDPLTGVAVLRAAAGTPGPPGSAGTPGGAGRPGPAGAAPGSRAGGPADGPVPQPGDVVLGLGMAYPGGATASRLAMGEVTAVGVNTRDAEDDPVLDAIATDLPMDGTGLGAPILDRRGRLLGMVVSAGPGRPTLAVPIGTARRAAAALASSGTVPHGWLGIESGVTTPGGLAVSAVAPDSPALRAGVSAGDVITAVDGAPVRSMEDLAAHVGLAQPGQEVTLELSRPPRRWSVRVVLVALPEG